MTQVATWRRARGALAVGMVALALTACGGTKDKQEDKTDPAVTGGTPSAADDPWAADKPADKAADPGGSATATAPLPMAGTTGAGAGDELAKLDTNAEATKSIAGVAKVDPDSITKAGIPQQAMRGFAGVEQTGFRVAYAPSPNPVHEQFRAVFQNEQIFEKIATGMNQTIRLPRTVDIQMVDCGTVNAFYDPNSNRIIVCYELISYFLETFKGSAGSNDELGQAVIGAVLFSFFHEVGHGLIHQLDLPAVGREEDSADQLATLVLMAAGDDGVGMALSGAYWFHLQEKSGKQTPFWDEHAFDGQRFYNILCLIYGSDTAKYGGFVKSGDLPENRAARCPEEHGKISKAWDKLLAPHLTSAGAENIDIKPTIQEPPAPPPDEPGEVAITCEQVAEKAVMLIAQEAQKKLAAASAEELAAAKQAFESELPAFLEQFMAQCAKEDWPAKDRQCVLDAESLEQASACGAG